MQQPGRNFLDRSGDEKVFTLFIDNIHPRMSNRDLKSIFQRIGKVVDVFVSRKKRVYTYRCFGFVRFEDQRLATEAIRRVDGRFFEGEQLRVDWASFRRNQSTTKQRINKLPQQLRWVQKQGDREPGTEPSFVRGTSLGDQTTLNDALGSSRDILMTNGIDHQEQGVFSRGKRSIFNDPVLRCVNGIVCQENRVWLDTSLIMETKCPMKLEEIRCWMEKWDIPVASIRDMGNFKFLVSLDSKEAFATTLNRLERSLESKCFTVRRWSEEEVCKRRCVWIEIFGIPPYAWCRENVERIVKDFGNLAWIDSSSEEGLSLESIKALVHTDLRSFIEDHLLLRVGEKSHEIFIRELENPVRVVPSFFCTEQGEVEHAVLLSPSPAMEEDIEGLHGNDKEGEDGNVEKEDVGMHGIPTAEEDGDVQACLSGSTLDDAAHLPPREAVSEPQVVRDSLLELEVMESLDTSKGTATAEVFYNLDEELDLINQWVSTVGCPPGFAHLGPKVACDEIQQEESTNMIVSTSQKKKRKTAGVGRRTGRRKTNKVQSKPSHSDSKHIVSTDDESLDDYNEAKKTWDVGKELNLFAEQEEEALQHILNLRRSSRKKNKPKAF